MTHDNSRLEPETEYAKPTDIVRSPFLTRAEKLDLLHQWEQNALQLQEAATEGMAGGETGTLQAVRRAIRDVEAAHE